MPERHFKRLNGRVLWGTIIMAKKPKFSSGNNTKKVVIPPSSSDSSEIIWVFDNVDRSGNFHFTPNREDMDCQELLTKIMDFSSQTWSQIKAATHDGGKSKHHFLDISSLSKEAMDRIEALKLSEYGDSIFSLRINNLIRIIGIRQNEKFIVKWYDPKHEFCPSKR